MRLGDLHSRSKSLTVIIFLQNSKHSPNNLTHINALAGSAVFFSLPLLLLLLQFLDALFEYVGPEIPLEVGQLLGTGQTVFSGLLEDVLHKEQRNDQSVEHTVQVVKAHIGRDM